MNGLVSSESVVGSVRGSSGRFDAIREALVMEQGDTVAFFLPESYSVSLDRTVIHGIGCASTHCLSHTLTVSVSCLVPRTALDTENPA